MHHGCFTDIGTLSLSEAANCQEGDTFHQSCGRLMYKYMVCIFSIGSVPIGNARTWMIGCAAFMWHWEWIKLIRSFVNQVSSVSSEPPVASGRRHALASHGLSGLIYPSLARSFACFRAERAVRKHAAERLWNALTHVSYCSHDKVTQETKPTIHFKNWPPSSQSAFSNTPIPSSCWVLAIFKLCRFFIICKNILHCGFAFSLIIILYSKLKSNTPAFLSTCGWHSSNGLLTNLAVFYTANYKFLQCLYYFYLLSYLSHYCTLHGNLDLARNSILAVSRRWHEDKHRHQFQ